MGGKKDTKIGEKVEPIEQQMFSKHEKQRKRCKRETLTGFVPNTPKRLPSLTYQNSGDRHVPQKEVFFDTQASITRSQHAEPGELRLWEYGEESLML